MKFYFQELRVYQEAKEFSSNVFVITRKWPVLYRYNLTDQLIRAALSISLNIAEGSSRTNRDFQHFLTIARGSCYECIPIFEIARGESLISDRVYEDVLNQAYNIAKMISGLRSSLQEKT